MGAGKSTVGALMAQALGRPYLDNDELLHQQTGRTAVELAAEGGNRLHEAESRQLRSLGALRRPFVAAVAASVADRPDDLQLLRSLGDSVYLRLRPETLARRVGVGQGRPWLGGDQLTVLTEMFSARDPVLVRVADVVIDCDELVPAAIVTRALDGLRA